MNIRLLPLQVAAILLATGAALLAQESRPVIDFGDNLFWYNTAIPQYRAGIAPVTREKLAEGEFLNGHPFRLDKPLSPTTADYNTRGNNTRFYGGMKTHCWDNPTNKYTWSEGGNNVDHEGFDDFNYMAYALESLHTPEKPGNRLTAIGVWLWKKEDFLNDGDKYPVTFDDTSRVGVYLSRTYPVNEEHAARLIAEGKVPHGTKPFNDTYANQRLEVVPREHWKGWESVHIVIRDGEQFWVAEPAFEPVKQTLIEVSPTKVRWAKYDPKGPWDFDFDHTKAKFEDHTFNDVTAAGWMIVKNEPTNAGLWCKWYGFGMDAVVNRPWRPSQNLSMVKLAGPDGPQGLYMSSTEVPYGTCRKIARWATRNQWAMHSGLDFDRDGNMGSMGWMPGTHSPDEPVTGISLLDAAVWCNALSEFKGLRPVYYSDKELTKPLKTANPFRTISRQWTLQSFRFGVNPRPFDKFLFYVDPAADGFRLPTSTEWTALAGGGKFPTGDTLEPAAAWFADNSGERTHPVGTARPTGAGFRDFSGNVFEWTIEPLKEPQPNPLHRRPRRILPQRYQDPRQPARHRPLARRMGVDRLRLDLPRNRIPHRAECTLMEGNAPSLPTCFLTGRVAGGEEKRAATTRSPRSFRNRMQRAAAPEIYPGLAFRWNGLR